MSAFLLPIADREPLAWILAQQRTAFPAGRVREAQLLRRGDRLFLYSTRGCFHNPTRDRGRIIGVAIVTANAEELEEPVRFGGREFPIGVKLRIQLLAPLRQGVELAPLVERLDAFPDPQSWSARMRRALVPLASRDAGRLERELNKVAVPYPRELKSYAA
jgi:hypothetical protein